MDANPKVVVQCVPEAKPSISSDCGYSSSSEVSAAPPSTFFGAVPLWVEYLLLDIFGTITLLIPRLLIILTCDRRLYTPDDASADLNPTVCEIFRASTIAAVTYCVYFSCLTIMSFVPFLITILQRIFNRDLLDKRSQDNLDYAMMIRHYFAFPCASLAFWMMVRYTLALFAASGDMLASSKISRFYAIQCSFTVLVFALLLLLEKIILQSAAINYHYEYYADRVSDNLFGMAAIRKLRKKFPPVRRKSAPFLTQDGIDKQEISDLAMAIQKGLCGEERDSITCKDLEIVFSEEDAGRFFSMLDRDENGDLTMRELIDGLQYVYVERDLLSHSLAANDDLIARLDSLGFGLVLMAVTALCLPIFNVSLLNSAIYIVSTGMGAIFVFEESFKVIFDTIIFIFISHPFDVGDVVMLDDKKYQVKSIGWWSSSFYGAGQKLVYISNSELIKMKVGNFRRSGPQTEKIRLNVAMSTTSKQLFELEERLDEFVVENRRDFQGEVKVLVGKLESSECMKIKFEVGYRSNFQLDDLLVKRRAMLTEYLRRTMEQINIQLAWAE